jgi:hypothetical protein
MTVQAASPVGSITGSGPMVSLNAQAASGAGQDFSIPTALQNWTVQITFTGGTPVITINFQVSLDDVNWTSVGTAISAAGLFQFLSQPALYVRLNVASYSGSGSITGTIVGAN